MATAAGRLEKRSIGFEPDMLRWLELRGERMDRSVDWQIREFVRELMERERVDGDSEAA